MRKFNARNMPHIKATLKASNKIIYEDDETLIVYNKKANIYIAEGSADTILDKIKKLGIERLETSNKEVFDYFYAIKKFKYHQICLQCYHAASSGKANLESPLQKEISWIAKTSGSTIKYITAIYKNNELFVSREKGKIVSYIGIHIDGSIGPLYTRPKYRRQGYATRIEEELLKIKKEPIFLQILEDNKVSIAMHKKNGWKFNRYKIYWLFNEVF